MSPTPLAYFITFTTYGTWLPGRAPGWIDRTHNQYGTPIPLPDAQREAAHRSKMRQPEYRLDQPQRSIVLRTIVEVATNRRWQLWAAHVRTNHVHIVITAAATPEKVMNDFKSWSSRRLREAFREDVDRDRWTQHGSTKYLWTAESLAEKVIYVVDRQGIRMEFYDYRIHGSAGFDP